MFAPYSFEKPEAPVKADPFSLDALIAWLRTKPVDEEYDYTHPGHCLLAQYTLSNRGEWSSGKYHLAGHTLSTTQFINDVLEGRTSVIYEIVQGGVGNFRHTFGAALSRALAIKARTP